MKGREKTVICLRTVSYYRTYVKELLFTLNYVTNFNVLEIDQALIFTGVKLEKRNYEGLDTNILDKEVKQIFHDIKISGNY